MADGLLLVDKPKGITSHDAVDAVRRALSIRKVGHAGTLDPMATGLLVMGVGRATRLLRFLGDMDKEYEGTGRLGQETDTLDAEGEIVRTAPVDVSEADVVGGMAVLTVDLRAFDGRDVDFLAVCSGGTYVRSLVADLGGRLGTGAHLTRLVRTRVGPFRVEDASPPDAPGPLLPLERAVGHLPRMELSEDEAEAAGHGRPLGPPDGPGFHAAFDPRGRLVGVYRDCGTRACPEVIIPD
jgi:tRNA pseudouridine55 synthase